MTKPKKQIAVVIARSGSKRIPGKNIKIFNGLPIIAWTINAAKKSDLFDHILVSTDSDQIAAIAEKFGAEVPFIRPAALSDDLAGTVPVMTHAVDFCQKNGWYADYFCCLYPCAPFIQVEDLIKALHIAIINSSDFVYPVTEYPHPAQRAMRMLKNGKMEFFNAECEMKRTQDLERSYHDAGQFYWGKSQAWLDGLRMHTDGLGMAIPHWRVVDIDNGDDWQRAEMIHKTFFLAD